MAEINDQNYMRSNQYNDPARLRARVLIHVRYSRSKANWYRWVFEHVDLSDDEKVLELGCGPGDLWIENYDRIPPEVSLYLLDFSFGMLRKLSRSNSIDQRFMPVGADAQFLPFFSSGFNIVIANHMLYHVSDMGRALLEIQRVLKPEGAFYAATNGRGHMRELHDLVHEIYPPYARDNLTNLPFNLENAADILSTTFKRVEIFDFEDSLWVTETQPLVDYVLSVWGSEDMTPDQIHELSRRIQAQIDRQGGFYIQKRTGLARGFLR